MIPVFSEAQEYWLKLEKERYSVPKAKPVCNLEHVDAESRERRDKMMFDAGRFAAGATDFVAVRAHKALMKDFE
jgi:hypothetical protein